MRGPGQSLVTEGARAKLDVVSASLGDRGKLPSLGRREEGGEAGGVQGAPGSATDTAGRSSGPADRRVSAPNPYATLNSAEKAKGHSWRQQKRYCWKTI